jgi:hypothetical protein
MDVAGSSHADQIGLGSWNLVYRHLGSSIGYFLCLSPPICVVICFIDNGNFVRSFPQDHSYV